MSEFFEDVEIPEEPIAKPQFAPVHIPPWPPSTIPESFFPTESESDTAVSVSGNEPQIEKFGASTSLYNSHLEALQKLIIEGTAPTDAFRKLNLPNDPRIKKALMTQILMNTAISGSFPIELKKAVLASESFRLFMDASTAGDHKAAQQWAKVLGSDPQFGMNKKEVSISVNKDVLDSVLNEPDKVEFLE